MLIATASGLFRVDAAIITPCSVKANNDRQSLFRRLGHSAQKVVLESGFIAKGVVEDGVFAKVERLNVRLVSRLSITISAAPFQVPRLLVLMNGLTACGAVTESLVSTEPEAVRAVTVAVYVPPFLTFDDSMTVTVAIPLWRFPL
jgi:hypothetical protein